MACNTLQEILKSCEGNNTGGISKMYLGNGDFVTGYAVGSTGASGGIVTGITGATGEKMVEFQFNPNTSSYTESVTVDLVNGSTFYNQTITLVLNRREAAKRQKLLLITNSQPELTIIIKDSNGIFWAFGLDDDKVYVSGAEGGSGVAKSDANGYTITFTCQAAVPAITVDGDIIPSLLS